ncbi:VCBS repeat-containing protein [Spirosoma validum]|uniref:VCBS repeat-containing protein n=1 Tax=Spirosoma validum TaxID=2771355 RepID=A0A927GBU4_9BACT|nr:VCBS repeat-containing protein [Spirosoma validum]MBD2751974.1 VCBS repeat-containing protein [Spirosoma validum]
MMRFMLMLVSLATLLTSCSSGPTASEKPLFQLLDSTQTGVGFTNRLQNTDSLSILDYLYFYNGGGVATGDLNNDGLTDLYFVSNQGPNKLYLNKGKFTFTDVTGKSGTVGRSDWQTGVTMADVNGDGLLDIYVCAVSQFKGLKGANELYINNGPGPDGTPSFTERAAEFGLAFAGFSTQAAFFDYDHDGDLDCFLLNHAVHTSRSFDNVSTRNTRNRESGDYLFRNDGKRGGNLHFTDVSEQAGIFGAAMGYGLGIAVADLNNDGWEDLYVSNDFHEDDYYYVNNHKGGFTESVRQAFAHTSRFSMGNDIADVNNDGYPDVMTLDMYPADEAVEKASQGEDPLDIYRYKLSYGYMNQYSRNCLQLSLSGKKFIDIGVMAGVAATDWSWSPLLADYDNDGIKDLFVANGIARRPNDLDYVKYISDGSLQSALGASSKLDEKAIQLMPEGKVHNYLYRGTTSLQFEDKSETWGFTTPTLSCGASYADLDNDGDLDLITNNVNDPAGLYRNEATTLFPNRQHLTIKLKGNDANTFGIGAKVILKYTGLVANQPRHSDSLQMQQLMPTRGFESASAPELVFGLGQHSVIDSLVVIWPNQRMEVRRNVKANQTITLQQADAHLDATNYQYTASIEKPLLADVAKLDSIPYQHRENIDYFDFVRESLMPFKISTEGPHLAVGDVNDDGLEDLYAGGAKWQAGSLLIQQRNGTFKNTPQSAFANDSTYEDVDAAFFDADGDNDLDLYVVSGGNEFYNKMPEQFDRLYLNDGKGNFSRSANDLPPMYDNKSCVRPYDIDHDGDLDLFVGGRVVGMAYGKSPNSYLLINDGKGHFSDQTEQRSAGLRNAGMITDAVWADYDGDKDADLILAGDWMPIRVFANDNGKFDEVKTITTDETPLNGFYQRIIAADFDRDGDIDLMAGNLGTNTKLRKTPDSQLRMWVKDIDNNQTTEQIIAYNRSKEWYPLAMKDELGKQMPGVINKRFTNYGSFAGKMLPDVVKDDELKGADELTVNQFASVYLENQGGRFVVHELPMMAQVSKLFALQAIDIDHDGDLDVLGGGNFYGVSTYQGRYDASFGLVLRNDGKSKFTALSALDAGFLLNGEIRDIRSIKTSQGPLILVARNGASVQIFKPLRLK